MTPNIPPNRMIPNRNRRPHWAIVTLWLLLIGALWALFSLRQPPTRTVSTASAPPVYLAPSHPPAIAKTNTLAAPLSAQSIFSYRTELDSAPPLPIWSFTQRNGVNVTFANSLMVTSGAPTQAEDGWNSEAQLIARPRIDFNGQSGTSATWQLSRGSNARWSLAKLTLNDPDAGGAGYQCSQPAGQYFEIDCNIMSRDPGSFTENRYVCILQLRCANGENKWTMNEEYSEAGDIIPPYAYFDDGRTAELKLTYLGTNSSGEQGIAYAIDGDEKLQKWFPPAQWGGMDWLTASYSVVDWDTNAAITTSSFDETLDYFEIANFHDNAAPTINLTGATLESWYADPIAVTINATDNGVGLRCLRAAWDQWPVDDINCANTSALILNNSQSGDRTLYVRAWDFAGNQQTHSALFRRDTSAPTNPTAVSAGCSGVQSGHLVYWGTDPNGTPTTVTAPAAYAPTAIPSDTTYYLRLQTRDRVGHISAAKTLYTLRYDNTPPTTPTLIGIGCAAQSGIWQVSCADPAFTWSTATTTGAGLTGYRLYWGTSATGIPATIVASAAYDPGPVTTPSIYYLRIAATDQAGNQSNPTTLFALYYDATPPATPTLVAEPTYTAGSTNTLSWQPVIDQQVGGVTYQVRHAANATCSSDTVDTAWQDQTTYTFTGLTTGLTYYYCVRARDALANPSAWSPAVHSIQDATPPDDPHDSRRTGLHLRPEQHHQLGRGQRQRQWWHQLSNRVGHQQHLCQCATEWLAKRHHLHRRPAHPLHPLLFPRPQPRCAGESILLVRHCHLNAGQSTAQRHPPYQPRRGLEPFRPGHARAHGNR